MITNKPEVVSAIDTVFTRRNTATGWLWYPLLRLLAHGEPITIPELAAASNRTNDEVAHAVRELCDTEYDQHGRIVGHGITLKPTPTASPSTAASSTPGAPWTPSSFPSSSARPPMSNPPAPPLATRFG